MKTLWAHLADWTTNIRSISGMNCNPSCAGMLNGSGVNLGWRDCKTGNISTISKVNSWSAVLVWSLCQSTWKPWLYNITMLRGFDGISVRLPATIHRGLGFLHARCERRNASKRSATDRPGFGMSTYPAAWSSILHCSSALSSMMDLRYLHICHCLVVSVGSSNDESTSYPFTSYSFETV